MTFITIITVIFVTPVYAQSNDIGIAKIHPASPFYFLKSVREILELKFAKTSQEKGFKYFEFAHRRIREVKSLINVNRADLIPPALEKYQSNLNKVLGLVNFNDEVLGPQLIDELNKHIVALERLQGQTDNQRAKIAIRTAIYRISSWDAALLERLALESKAKLSSKIKVNQSLICDFLSKEASSSALNQTEKFVLQERVKKCLRINN